MQVCLKPNHAGLPFFEEEMLSTTVPKQSQHNDSAYINKCPSSLLPPPNNSPFYSVFYNRTTN